MLFVWFVHGIDEDPLFFSSRLVILTAYFGHNMCCTTKRGVQKVKNTIFIRPGTSNGICSWEGRKTLLTFEIADLITKVIQEQILIHLFNFLLWLFLCRITGDAGLFHYAFSEEVQTFSTYKDILKSLKRRSKILCIFLWHTFTKSYNVRSV